MDHSLESHIVKNDQILVDIPNNRQQLTGKFDQLTMGISVTQELCRKFEICYWSYCVVRTKFVKRIRPWA